VDSGPRTPRRVAILVYDNVTLLDVAGPADVFAHAGLFGGDYEIVLVSPDGSDATTSSGITLQAGRKPEDLGPLDIAIIPGALGLVTRPFDPALLAAVETVIAKATQVTSVCTGSFLLAQVGALDGRRATTHWNRIEQFERSYPSVRVKSDALFVRDGSFITSAGVSSGIDLALALVEQDYGPDVAAKVVRQMILFMQRPGGYSQFSSRSRSVPAAGSPLRPLLDAISAEPAADYSLARMSAVVGASPRTLIRLFREQLGTTPARYVEQARIEVAKGLLMNGSSVTRTAQLSGFNSAETLRRVFVNQVGVSPSVYASTAAAS
jgi:transcriptional regulator GlxA family with amidase domain